MKKLALFMCMLAVTMFIVSCSDDEDTLAPEEEEQEEVDNYDENSDENSDENNDENTDENTDDDTNVNDEDENITGGGSDYVPSDVVIAEYDGETADDAANDVVGEEEDFFWEINDFSSEITVIFSGETATVESSSKKVYPHIEGAYVTIDMETEGVGKCKITVSGSSDDGQLKIYGEKKFMLELAGLDLTCTKGPAINDQCGKRVFVHLADGTSNSLTDAAEYLEDPYYLDPTAAADEDRKGCFFSEGHMIFSGTGSLTVNGNCKSAIATDGYFYMRPGVTLVVPKAAKHAFNVKGDKSDDMGMYINGGYIYANVASAGGKCFKTDYKSEITGGKFRLYTTGSAVYDDDDKDISSPSCMKIGGDLNITGGDFILNSTGAGAKGINVDGNLNISGGTISTATAGGIYAYTSSETTSSKPIKVDGDIVIGGGDLNVSANGKDEKSEGISSDGSLTIGGGNILVYAYEDALSISKDVTINGGKVYCYSDMNDAIDSNGSITVNDGLVIATGTSGAGQGFDVADSSQQLMINGGTVISTGGIQDVPSTSSAQNSVIFTGIYALPGRTFAILDSSSNPLMTYELPRNISTMALMFSSSDLVSGSYTMEMDGTISGSDSWYGWYDGAAWADGRTFASFSVSDTVTTVDGSSAD